MPVLNVRRRRLPVPDDCLRETVALACTVAQAPAGSAREFSARQTIPDPWVGMRPYVDVVTSRNFDRDVIWVPTVCPVKPGDWLWPLGDYAFWTPRSQVAQDVRYMRPDRGWLPSGEPSPERARMAAAGRA